MKLIKMEKVKDGRYLKNYELVYQNKAGKEKKYEIVSRRELSGIEDIGKKTCGGKGRKAFAAERIPHGSK